MPESPSSSLFTHFVLENPWPAGLALLAISLILGWAGLREGLRQRVRVAAVLGVIGAALIAAGVLVTTAGEHGMQVTRSLVDAAVGKDLAGGLALFGNDATMHVGSPQSPGYDRGFIQARLADLAARYTIDYNYITTLRGATLSSDEAEVRLDCATTVTALPYPNASQWIVRVQRMPDGTWKITRLTCVAINGQQRLW